MHDLILRYKEQRQCSPSYISLNTILILYNLTHTVLKNIERTQSCG